MKYWMLLITTAVNCTTWASPSVCFGKTHQGAIKHSVKLPLQGANFASYSRLGWYFSRTHVHHQVAEIMSSSHAQLAQELPDRHFIYGETGWPQGGPFKPHKTHQNGLSVDFMVPVIDQQGRPAHLPLAASNQYGYQLEFDRQGRRGDLTIDFVAFAAHLKALHQAAQVAGAGIKRVLLAPDLQPLLLTTKDGAYLQQHIAFNQRQAWVRHDDHYHVDFAITCEPLSRLSRP
ncbi:penicillin-insensitive murein endopeptidase [Marinicella meishanensis]|uniref:penicillin-insensitive murein endopeptidase n=1 Tax=Marinicella meishanensis TaxID=2873263 RepID=UPI001CBC043D|nr:penicillin-insensitive murein endopeptidase [Marinicella sp. NBU2979]